MLTNKPTSGRNHDIREWSEKHSLMNRFFRGLSISSVFGFAMSVIYAGLGVFLLIFKNILNFSSFQQYGLGIILLTYGLFRFYTTLKKKRESELEENDEEL